MRVYIIRLALPLTLWVEQPAVKPHATYTKVYSPLSPSQALNMPRFDVSAASPTHLRPDWVALDPNAYIPWHWPNDSQNLLNLTPQPCNPSKYGDYHCPSRGICCRAFRSHLGEEVPQPALPQDPWSSFELVLERYVLSSALFKWSHIHPPQETYTSSSADTARSG